VPDSFSTWKPLHVKVCPGALLSAGQVPPSPVVQEKITSVQSKPEGQSSLLEQCVPQKFPVCPSLMKVRHEAPEPQMLDEAVQSRQSTRLGRVPQAPVLGAQNRFTSQLALRRQNGWHWPPSQACLSAQSASRRHPARQRAVNGSHSWPKPQCSSSVQGPLAMQRSVVMSQKLPGGQSAFVVQLPSVWQNPKPLQYWPDLQPELSRQRHAPELESQKLPGPHAASLMQTQRSLAGSLR
jgi:hypothetical protein